MERRIDLRQLVAVASLFMIAQFAGLLIVYTALPPQTLASFASHVAQQQAQTTANSVTYIIMMAIELVVIAAILIFVIRSSKGKNFFMLVEAYIVLLGGYFFFFLLIGDIIPYINATSLTIVSAVLALLLYLSKRSKRLSGQGFRNIVTIISSVGVGTFIGINLGVQLGVLVLYAILALFAIYDYLAVFVLKFMIPLARQAASMNLAFMIGSSEMELHPATKSRTKTYTAKELRAVKDPGLREMIKHGSTPMVSNIMLGNGDIMLPLLVSSGAYAYTANMSLAITIAIGSMVGLIATFWIIRKYRFGLPAIPPIFALVSVALAVFYTIAGSYYLVLVYLAGAALSLLAMYFGVKNAASAASQAALLPGRAGATARPLRNR